MPSSGGIARDNPAVIPRQWRLPASDLVSELHNSTAVRGAVFASGGFRSIARPPVGAGWRRADRLRGFGSHLDAVSRLAATAILLPLDRGEKSARLNPV